MVVLGQFFVRTVLVIKLDWLFFFTACVSDSKPVEDEDLIEEQDTDEDQDETKELGS